VRAEGQRQMSAELAAEARRDERVDERVHARVGVRQDMRGDARVVEGVRVSPGRAEEVGPQPDDVRRQPADGEHGHDDDDQPRHALLCHHLQPHRRPHHSWEAEV